MNAAIARLEPVSDDEAATEAVAVFEQFRSAGAAVPPLYRVLAHAPDQLRAWDGLAGAMRGSVALELPLDVPVVLRVAHVVGSNRQWRHQVGRAGAAGLSTTQLEALRSAQPGDHPGFDDGQRAAIAVATSVGRGDRPSDGDFIALVEALGVERTIAVVMRATYFRALAGLLAAFDLT
ncbi:MAG TPA: hypothetical protein PLZ93_00935 [Nocardioides sp.]|uniref:hypothetical protein n=1 Tax=uncultured Nocardioides sp. TaxID=198441 RepID=UPI000EDAFA27|nr:hypothetical protein [uncultured Nocardioides sp.]HCB05123.1 hypothetical protein [Nocardioides sp.]HRD59814.1 hypothetical protein [Nocardioides sp.]HRI94156.1 hypothetical protein [Nocardioides sp.]HRK45284.1 hypothetical protein [Nocardioides sp.]